MFNSIEISFRKTIDISFRKTIEISFRKTIDISYPDAKCTMAIFKHLLIGNHAICNCQALPSGSLILWTSPNSL